VSEFCGVPSEGKLPSGKPPRFLDAHALRQGLTVGIYELVYHLGYLVEREDARSMAVEHSGVIDVVLPTLQRRPDCEILDSGVRDAVAESDALCLGLAVYSDSIRMLMGFV
jgi:hypothetical protein